MKRYIFLALCALALAGAGFAKDNLAILPFTGGQQDEGETIAELFSFEPELTAVFNPVPRTSINRAIRGEQRFQLESGMTDPDTAAALGKQVGAQYVVSGSITALGNQKLLIIAILKIDDLRQIAGDIQTYANIEEIEGKLPSMARSIATAARADASKLPRLAVPPVTLSGGADSRAADVLARILAVRIIRSGAYAVYPRTASLEQIQEEYVNQLSGDTADEHLPGLGKGTNPELVLSVTARKLGSRNMFNAAIINLETGVQEAGESVNYQSLNDGITAMESLAFALAGQKGARAVSDAAAFTQAIAAINADSRDDVTIILSGSFAAASVTFTEGGAKTITLKGEGAARTITNSTDAPLFTVPPGITLVLDNNLVLDGNKKNGSLVAVDGGTLVMKAGSTLRGAERGVLINSGSFTMSGGTISGNSAVNGGGVLVDSTGATDFPPGSFTMSGGTISGNGASGKNWGSGVWGAKGCSFTISGGMISRNTTNGRGGGVWVNNGCAFRMSGGTISGNSAELGGGVFVNNGCTFTMNGGTISGNGASGKNWGSGVWGAKGCSFTISGGMISRNTTNGRGGGVWVNNGCAFRMSGGTISGNSAELGGGVFVNNGCTFTMNGGTINGNSAGDYSGGVFVLSGSFVKRGGGTIDADNTAAKGKVVYVEDGKKQRNSAAGPGADLDSGTRGRAGGWE